MLQMTRRRKIWLWLGLVFSLPAAAYAGISVVFYAWLNAAEPERWPAEKAALWAYSALALAVVFFLLFVYCLVSLIKKANRKYKEKQNAF
jgi:TRAP-type C4-dicarboxylate transport system permease small subunit